MDHAFQECAIRGDTAELHQLLSQYPLGLDLIQLGSLTHTPLHLSAFRGHLPFTIEVIKRCPSLVSALDARRRAPLHLAAAQGHVEVVKELARAGPEMCEVVDGDGYNPIHLAVVMGRAGVLTELVRVGIHAARGKTAGGDGILHLCVKYERLECLKILVENVKDPEFTNGKDFDGNNVFHQAVKYKQIQIINYIISNNIKNIDINATNAMGLTPLDIILHMNLKDMEIRDTLINAGARKAGEILASIPTNDAYASLDLHPSSQLNHSNHHESQNNIIGNKDWLPRRRDSLMVVASLIALMAFAAGLNPFGVVWQENSPAMAVVIIIDVNEIAHRAGEAIIAYNYPNLYKFYLRSNTIAYVSLSIILLLISGLHFRRWRYMWILEVVMWVTTMAMSFTYMYALVALTPKNDKVSFLRTLIVMVIVRCIMMALVFLVNAIRLFMKWIIGKGKACWRGIHHNHNPQIK